MYTAVYASYMVFSPYDPVVNMVLIWTGITYFDYFPMGLIMVFFIILISSLLIQMDKNLFVVLKNRLSTVRDMGDAAKIYELFFHVLVLIALAFLGARYVRFSNQLFVIALIIIFYAILWGKLLKVLAEYKEELRV
ncbi:hypothetical protein [Tepidibacillus marianensis]|uniref:hypothetical protein n=1 Tax=Tepidibacillus marianensis TaxID=3131995 RepID=UPI0030D2DF95